MTGCASAWPRLDLGGPAPENEGLYGTSIHRMTAAPRAEPPSFAVFDTVWAAHGAEDAWVFTSHMMRHGDLFIALSLMEAFRQQHGGGKPVRLIAVTRGHAAVAAMFMHVLDSVHVAPEMTGPPVEELLAWSILRGRADFAPGRLLLLQPWILARPPLRLDALVDTGRISYTDLLRAALNLPAFAATLPPPVARDDRAAALALLRDAGLAPGRTLVLFPYAQSFQTDWSETLALVVAAARADGWQVATSCAGAEQPVPGTTAVDVPFPLLRPFCEAAGQAVSARSGISDMLAQAACRHVVLYGRPDLMAVWGLQAMGLGGSAAELVLGGTPAALAAQIRSLLTQPDEGAQTVACPAEVANALQILLPFVPRGEAGATRTVGLAGPHLRLGRGLACPDVVLTDGWLQEDWGAWTFGARASLWLRVPAQAGRLTLHGHAAVSEAFPDLHLVVSLGRIRHAVTITWPLQDPLITLPLPAGLNPTLPLLVGIEIRNPQSPALLSDGANPDHRPLGLALRGVGFG